MAKRVAIVQSNYIPWKGYFDLIRAVDEFVLLDDVQYTQRDWRNRNLIKTANGLQWLTVPVHIRGRSQQKIRETEIDGSSWAVSHWRAIERAYARTKYFRPYRDAIESTYALAAQARALSEVNRLFIGAICRAMDIHTPIRWSMEYTLPEGKTDRLLAICQQAGASHYLSGPAARSYLDQAMFERAGTRVQFADYSRYGEYPQLHPPFVHGVSVLDLLFNAGPDAGRYLIEFPRSRD